MAKTQPMIISTKHEHVSLKHLNDQLNLSIHQNLLEAFENKKYRGDYIEKSLDWKQYIHEISKTISRSFRPVAADSTMNANTLLAVFFHSNCIK